MYTELKPFFIIEFVKIIKEYVVEIKINFFKIAYHLCIWEIFYVRIFQGRLGCLFYVCSLRQRVRPPIFNKK